MTEKGRYFFEEKSRVTYTIIYRTVWHQPYSDATSLLMQMANTCRLWSLTHTGLHTLMFRAHQRRLWSSWRAGPAAAVVAPSFRSLPTSTCGVRSFWKVLMELRRLNVVAHRRRRGEDALGATRAPPGRKQILA